tara:strand:+ start:4124 stop:6007 length:1884 start_codon:yes stop_codon:yes gene_type:complete
MATVEQIKLELVAEESATEPIKKVTDATRELGRQTKKTSRDSKAGFSEISDLFGSVLPRSMQRLLRGFKGTQRQVKRLSKSFKVLKAAWASIGIGLILIALEELISNWSKYSEMLGLSNAAEEKKTANLKEQKQAIDAVKLSTRGLIDVLDSETASVEAQDVALAELNRTFKGVIDTEATREEQIKQAKAAQEALAKVEGARVAQAQAAADLEAKNAVTSEGFAAFEKEHGTWLGNNMDDYYKAKRLTGGAVTAERKAQEALTEAQAEYQKLLDAAKKREEDKAAGVKLTSEQERLAAAAKKKSEMEAAADAEWLANQRVQAQTEASLRLIKDDEKRELKRLEIQQKAAEQELVDRGGDLLDVLALDAEYEAERDEIIAGYKQQRDDKAKADEEAEALKKSTLLEALNTDEQNELLRAQERFLALQLLAKDDAAALLQIEQDYLEEKNGIITKYADKETATTQKTQDSKLAAYQKFGNSVSGLLREMQGVSEGNQKAQRRLAIADIIVNQSIAMAAAVAGAVKNSAKKGGNPIVMAAYIATALATVVGTFASIKSVFAKSGDSGGGIGEQGSGGGGYTNPRSIDPTTEGVPLMLQRTDTPSMQAYVVQSQLQGQMSAQDRLNQQIYL